MALLLAVFQPPIIILNFVGFIVSAVWLLVIGEWRWVIAGLLTAMVAPFILGLALLPGALIAGPGVYFANRRITIGVYFFGLLSSVYTYAIIAAWCSGVTFYFLNDTSSRAFWPMLFWCYGIATSPWTYMAQKEQTAVAFLAAFFAQVAFIVMIGSIAVGVDLIGSFQAFSLVMVVGVLFQMKMLAEARRIEISSTDV